MNLPPPEEIQRDIDKLVETRINCQQNVTELEAEIGRLRDEQAELRTMVSAPGPYDPGALTANADRIDGHIARIRGMIILEGDKVGQLDYIIRDLERRKWQSEARLQLTGMPPQDS